MPTKRDILGQLSRGELLAVLDEHGLGVADRRKKDDLVETLAGSRAVKLDVALGRLARERLKELCRALGLDDSGKEKAAIVERLIGSGASRGREKPGHRSLSARAALFPVELGTC